MELEGVCWVVFFPRPQLGLCLWGSIRRCGCEATALWLQTLGTLAETMCSEF